ncbi:hypothetical protein ACQ4M3_12890 [Leptolyngbya sp. AN03gr2]|uniref:hypothetical protein n=1 Tax=unclassified Leptolyngbya TaxID=2650499 RepID=UPI003D31C94B
MSLPDYTHYLTEIQQFITPITGYGQATWIYSQSRILAVYLRVRPRLIKNQFLWGVDVANIQVRSHWQRKGYGTRLIEAIHAINPHGFTYVELAHHPGLQKYLEQSGWSWDEPMDDPSYYKLTQSLKTKQRSEP